MRRSLLPLALVLAACGKPVGGSESSGGAPGAAPASSRDACTAFESRIENGPSTLNDVRSLHGVLKLSCAVPGAGMLAINVTFDDCSFDNRAQAL